MQAIHALEWLICIRSHWELQTAKHRYYTNVKQWPLVAVSLYSKPFTIQMISPRSSISNLNHFWMTRWNEALQILGSHEGIHIAPSIHQQQLIATWGSWTCNYIYQCPWVRSECLGTGTMSWCHGCNMALPVTIFFVALDVNMSKPAQYSTDQNTAQQSTPQHSRA